MNEPKLSFTSNFQKTGSMMSKHIESSLLKIVYSRFHWQ